MGKYLTLKLRSQGYRHLSAFGDQIHKRNEGLVALTRTRIWCVVTGLESPIFDELKHAKDQFPHLVFPAFNKKSLKRVTDQLPQMN